MNLVFEQSYDRLTRLKCHSKLKLKEWYTKFDNDNFQFLSVWNGDTMFA